MKIDETRAIIVKTAHKLFSRFGFHKTSMEEIAKLARKAKGSLYYYFSSKEDLYKEVITNELKEIQKQLSEVIEIKNISSFEKLKRYLLLRMELMNNATNYHETLKSDFFEKLHFLDKVRSDFDNWEKETLKTIILEGINNNEFVIDVDIEAATDVFVMVLKGLEVQFFLQNKYQKYASHFEGLINILQKGISKIQN